LQMRWTLTIIILIIHSCKPLSEAEKLHQTLTGKWLLVYPDHKLRNDRQELIYGRIQDSIVSLKGLKLLRLSDNGVFQQLDSPDKKGRWGMTAGKIVFVEDGGKGFDNFSAYYSGYNDGMMELTEFIETGGEKIELAWKLKKITGGAASGLFEESENAWRKRPDQPESEKQMRQRLAEMLRYYSDYFKLVTKESSFFVTTRIILPFKFYQHAMGMKTFDEQNYFVQLFFNRQQAEQAWQYLKRCLTKLRNDFPSKENYVEEYAGFMEKMSEDLVKE